RTYRQVGSSLVVVVIAATSFSTTGAADIAHRWLPQRNDTVEAVAPVVASDGNVEVKTVTSQNAIANGTVEQPDTSAKVGTRRVVQTGVPGVEMVSYIVTTVNGVEVDRMTGLSVVVTAPTDEIVAVGALTIPAATEVQKGTNRALGQQMALDGYGWTGDEWSCLDNLWARESGWSHTAGNKSSGAYGIPQALPGSKMAVYGADWETNPATQITWGLHYIQDRYATPCGAWGHFTAKNWY
ncbi:MAG: G5 domain-containing protein, partial [Demequinaceae bacterium]|nr:G5 domain-containing protein [Demequinaceae bacterium]